MTLEYRFPCKLTFEYPPKSPAWDYLGNLHGKRYSKVNLHGKRYSKLNF